MEARAYVERTLHQLCFAHDASYLSANLSARGHELYPESQQHWIIYHLKKLGVPTTPLHLEGTFKYGEAEGEHSPLAHYEATAAYPTALAHFYLDVSRQVSGWRIDYFAASWKDKNAPAAPESA